MATATGRRITTEEATVKTATVEIKALTIGGKQVTLAVFRQLIEEPIIDEETGQLRGVPWGTVNYHSGVGCHGDDDHLHVVWQKGSELRRSLVDRVPNPFRHLKDYEAIVASWTGARIAEGWRVPRNKLIWDTQPRIQMEHFFGAMDYPIGGDAAAVFFEESAKEVSRFQLANHPEDERLAEVAKRNIAFRAKEAQEARERLLSQGSSDDWLERKHRWEEDHRAWSHRYNATYDSLASLDQLFIAV